MKWLHRLMNPNDYISKSTIKNYLEIVETESENGINDNGLFSKMGFFYEGWNTLIKHMNHDIDHSGLKERIPMPKERMK